MIKVLMYPPLSSFAKEESGIKRVVESYYYYGPQYGFECVEVNHDDYKAYDVFAIHAGTTNVYPPNKPTVAHLHGLYWTADYAASAWEWKANANVIESIRRATLITVPSEWVSETIKRDIRVSPYVIPHGIDPKEWETDQAHDSYILWNKNRNMDVCDPRAVGELALRFPNQWFVTTFGPHGMNLHNIEVIGLWLRPKMKEIIQKAGIYLSTTKETFGIGILEALASGVPVLGFAHGGNKEIVEHGVNGYLAIPNDYDDLAVGLQYCLDNLRVLSHNAKLSAKKWTWEEPIKKLVGVYKRAIDIHTDKQRPHRIDDSLYLV